MYDLRESISRLTETGSGNNRHAQKVFYYAGLMQKDCDRDKTEMYKKHETF
jgi:hypothetical protein